MSQDSTEIEGLVWETRDAIPNGTDSFVVPFATTHLIHLVYHGADHFSHGRYGLHFGLEDHLTFLGCATQRARGYFVDCRAKSPTYGRRVALDFTPDPSRTLIIPCGVGHGFEALEGVFTLNQMRAFLPPPSQLLTEQSPWATGADIYNFPYDTPAEKLPVVTPNPYPASEIFYEVLSEMQKATLDSTDYEFPHTEDVTEADGRTVTLMFRKKLSEAQQLPEWTPLEEIDGVGWQRHLLVWAGPDSGYAALADAAPLQVISHGERRYDTDAYGIHLEWQDRLTFVGPPDQIVTIKLIDCRAGSPTEGIECEHRFLPSPLRMLIIPAGVAHAFAGLERVHTINRPLRCAGDPEKFEPGNDVLDWPLHQRPAPRFSIEPRDFGFGYYFELARRQRDYLARRHDDLTTPSVLLVDDGAGGKVTVALRQRTKAV